MSSFRNNTCYSTHITLPNNIKYNQVTSKISFTSFDKHNKYAIGEISYYLDDIMVGSCTLEGKELTNKESIFTSHLDLSNVSNYEQEVSQMQYSKITSSKNNALIYKKENGNIVISKTLQTVFILIVIFLLLILVVYLIITKIISNINFSTNKFIFKFKRFTRKFMH